MPLSLKPLEFLNEIKMKKKYEYLSQIEKKNEAYGIFIGDSDSDLDCLQVELKERKKCRNTDAYVVALGDSDSD